MDLGNRDGYKTLIDTILEKVKQKFIFYHYNLPGRGWCSKYLLHNNFIRDISIQVYSLPRSTRTNYPGLLVTPILNAAQAIFQSYIVCMCTLLLAWRSAWYLKWTKVYSTFIYLCVFNTIEQNQGMVIIELWQWWILWIFNLFSNTKNFQWLESMDFKCDARLPTLSLQSSLRKRSIVC